MGGHDPYSSSKGCAELVTAAWRRSFFLSDGPAPVGLRIGPGRQRHRRRRLGRGSPRPRLHAGVRAGAPVVIRRPAAVRPWQHVLEPLDGLPARSPSACRAIPRGFGEAWNFGPSVDEARPVAWVVDRLSPVLGRRRPLGARCRRTHPHEAGLLQVDASKARARLGWTPRLSLEEGLRWTVDWYRRFGAGEDAAALTLDQIERFEDWNSDCEGTSAS